MNMEMIEHGLSSEILVHYNIAKVEGAQPILLITGGFEKTDHVNPVVLLNR
jgi:hypothetical protein